MHSFKKLSRKNSRKTNDRQPSERPSDWHLTFSDLMEEIKTGKRKIICQTELDWAGEYERSLLPDDIQFPASGDVYESLDNQTINYLTAWEAPSTGKGQGNLLKGEKVWINSEPVDLKAIGTYALPIEYKELEDRMISQENRENRNYNGFYFYFKTIELHSNFKLVRRGYNPSKP
jgi:hypothetical protein